MTDHVTQDRMRELIDTGEATPMLAGMDIGPTHYDGRWWYVPSEADDDADYQAADPDKAERFDALRRRAEAADRVQAELDEHR
ncbi:MAG TPA: hypothetical protein VG497_15590 [Kribbella sp.]|nr:hypothetical protein [Kribbella sp.]